jgi:hypothetical protein
LSNLTIAPTSGGADTTAPFGCNVSDHTCWATTLGVYTVTGTYNGLTATSSYTVSSYVPGMTAYIFTGSSMSDVVTKEATLSNAVYTYH